MGRMRLVLAGLFASTLCATAAASDSASLVCNPAQGENISLDLKAFSFATKQPIDSNTGLPTGKITSSLKFESPFRQIYKTLRAAAESNETFSTCTLFVMAPTIPVGMTARWTMQNAVLTNLAVDGEEGNNGSTVIEGTLTFKSAEFAWP